jgi:cytochrome c biogenesis protein CcdA/thiol-disulfide isomerase/thioredoxin
LAAVLVLLGIGFLAGVITAVSPCVLPVLPILLAGGASGRKPLRIIAGLVTSFVVFTLFATWILEKLGLPDDLLRNIAIALLFLVAATLVFPQFGAFVERPFAGLTRFRTGGGGFLLGASLGLVFVPCAGPVLATISVVAATNNVGWRAILLTIAYALGAAVPMLLVAFGGQQLAGRLRGSAPRLRFVSGIVIALVALALVLNADTRFQTLLPGYTQALQKHIEDTSTARRELQKVSGVKSIVDQTPTTTTTPVATPGPGASNLPVLVKSAPEIVAGGRWFNSKPLTLTSLRGKVVLLDFWTYSCINCLRTLPHLEAWYSTYHPYGLEIIGVHSPEFAFEHVASNVQAAVERLGIHYPVVQDNNFATWNAYGNEYWPADYLIDQQGRIRAYTTGEGGYDTMETDIRELLGVQSVGETSVPDLTPSGDMTPESYLGYIRLDPSRYVGGAIARNAAKTYPARRSVPLDALSYSGTWTVEGDRAVAGKDAGLSLHFQGSDVYLVLGGRGRVTVSLPGKQAKTMLVNAYRLYTLVSSPSSETALLHLRMTPGVQAYAFTFG